MLAAAPEEDLVTKEHTTHSSNTSPLPHVCEDMTLQLLCTAITNHHHHHCGPLSHSPAGIEDTASASHHDDGQGSSASLLTLLPPLLLFSSNQWPCFFNLQGRGV